MSITISSELPIKSNEIITSIGQQNFIRTADNIRLEEYSINAGVVVKTFTFEDILKLLIYKDSSKKIIQASKDLYIKNLDTLVPTINFNKSLIILNNQINIEFFENSDVLGFIPTTYKFIIQANEFELKNNSFVMWFKTNSDTQNGLSNSKFLTYELIPAYQRLQSLYTPVDTQVLNSENNNSKTNDNQYSYFSLQNMEAYDFVNTFKIQMKISFTLFYMEKKIIW
jgi:hypothetical protein